MKSLVVFLFLFFSFGLSAQTAFVYSINKEGKVTHKECQSVTVKLDHVIFIVNGTSYQIFQQVGTSSDGAIWMDTANNKVVQRNVQDDGTVVFWKSEKKAFYYKPLK